MPCSFRPFEGTAARQYRFGGMVPPALIAYTPWSLLLGSGGGGTVLWTIFVVLLVLWLLGFSLHVAGGLIHLLLVIAAVLLIVNLLTGRRTAV